MNQMEIFKNAGLEASHFEQDDRCCSAGTDVTTAGICQSRKAVPRPHSLWNEMFIGVLNRQEGRWLTRRTDGGMLFIPEGDVYERMWRTASARRRMAATPDHPVQDINYQLSQNEDKTAIFEGWCDFSQLF